MDLFQGVILTRHSRNQKGPGWASLNVLKNPPTRPLPKGGEGGFLKFVASLRTILFIRDESLTFTLTLSL